LAIGPGPPSCNDPNAVAPKGIGNNKGLRADPSHRQEADFAPVIPLIPHRPSIRVIKNESGLAEVNLTNRENLQALGFVPFELHG
jgi:hypothetical protein